MTGNFWWKVSVLALCPVTVIRYHDKKHWGGRGRAVLAHDPKLQTFRLGKSRQQEHEVAGHIASIHSQDQRRIN